MVVNGVCKYWMLSGKLSFVIVPTVIFNISAVSVNIGFVVSGYYYICTIWIRAGKNVTGGYILEMFVLVCYASRCKLDCGLGGLICMSTPIAYFMADVYCLLGISVLGLKYRPAILMENWSFHTFNYFMNIKLYLFTIKCIQKIKYVSKFNVPHF